MNRINKLLSQYWAGDTTIAEEQELKDYFSGNTIDPEHLPLRALFLLDKSKESNVFSSSFDADLLAKLETDSPSSVNSLIAEPTAKIRKTGLRRWWSAAAAVALLMVAITGWLKTPAPAVDLAEVPHLIVNGKIYQPATEAEALELTRQALRLVSSKMNTRKAVSKNK